MKNVAVMHQHNVDSKAAKENDKVLNLIFVGHVDHGKSTIIGRLLSDCGSFSAERLTEIKNYCERNSKQFEYAYLIDSLHDERTQGITIDFARIYFTSKKRRYLIIDAPGHSEFLRNFATGAYYADAAVLVVDAHEGLQENSRRHAYILSFLGIRSLIVLINKMDLIDYSEEKFSEVRDSVISLLSSLNLQAEVLIPTSGGTGECLALAGSVNMPWWTGPTLIEAIDSLDLLECSENLPFRMYVQDVYKFTSEGDSRRIIAGTISSGRVKEDDEIIFYPSGKKSSISRFEQFSGTPPPIMSAGSACGFTLKEQIFVSRGELACINREASPSTAMRIQVRLFWLGEENLKISDLISIRIGTAKVKAKVESISRILDSSSLEFQQAESGIKKTQVAEVTLGLERPVSFDSNPGIQPTNRFVAFSNYRIVGGGIIVRGLNDSQSKHRDSALLGSQRWVSGGISPAQRAERFHQRPLLVIITGERESDRISLAKAVESDLFECGHLVYFLGIGNLLHGLDTDLPREKEYSDEHIRRLAEVANILLDSGMILILTAAEITADLSERIRTLISGTELIKIWLGEELMDNKNDLILPKDYPIVEATSQVVSFIKNAL